MRKMSWMYSICTLLLSFTVLSMQEPRSATPLKARPPSTLTLEENLGLHIRFSGIENKIDELQDRIRSYQPQIDQAVCELQSATQIIASNNEVIDALQQYQSSVAAVMPFFQKIIVSNSHLFTGAEMSHFGQLVETIIAADAECKKKAYGE